MKNTFVLNGLNITIEGQPIAIDKLEVTSEMSAQEIATSGGLIKQLVGELKPLITEAIKPATPAVTTKAPTPTNHNYSNNYSNNYKNKYNSNYGNNNYKNDNYNKSNKDNTRALNIQSSFDALERPEDLREDKYKTWIYESGSYCNGDRIKVNIDNTKHGVLHVNIITCYLQVNIHVYPDKTTWHGASAATFSEMLKHIGMPEELQAYLLKVVTL